MTLHYTNNHSFSHNLSLQAVLSSFVLKRVETHNLLELLEMVNTSEFFFIMLRCVNRSSLIGDIYKIKYTKTKRSSYIKPVMKFSTFGLYFELYKNHITELKPELPHFQKLFSPSEKQEK